MSQSGDDCPSPEKKQRRHSDILQKDVSGETNTQCNDDPLNTDITETHPNKYLDIYSSEKIGHTMENLEKSLELKSRKILHNTQLCKDRYANGDGQNVCQAYVPYQISTPLFSGTTIGGNLSLPLYTGTSALNLGKIQFVTTSLGSNPQAPPCVPSTCNTGSMQLVNTVQPVQSVNAISISDSFAGVGTVTPVSNSSPQYHPHDSENKVILKTLLFEPVQPLVSRLAPSTASSKEYNTSDKQPSTNSRPSVCSCNSVKQSVSSDSHITNECLKCSSSSNRTKGKQLFTTITTTDGTTGDDDTPGTSDDFKLQDEEVPAKPDAFNLSQSESYDDKKEQSEMVRPLRKSQRKGKSCDTVVCPVCRVAVKLTDITEHLSVETARLNKWAQEYRRKQSRRHTTESSSASGGPISIVSHKDRYQSFLRVKHHRQERGSSGSKRGSGTGTQCPVCNEHISGTQYQLNQHVERCLLKDSADIDVEGSSDSEGYEEYEWAGQTRIRVSSLLPGSSLAESGFVVGQKSAEAEDVELDIEDDETDTYGEAQYNEADLIPCTADEPEEESGRQAIRDILLQESSQSCSSTPVQRSLHTTDKWNSEESIEKEGTQCTPFPSVKDVPDTSKMQKDDKTKTASSDKYRCLICMENYDSPATSIQCWHVYCEECWLRTLGAKKLCPQCNAITHPSDLRRIYL